MNDAEWDIFQAYIELRINERGGNASFMTVLKNDFNELKDQALMATALGDLALATLTSQRDTLDADREALDDEITRLEGRSGGGR